MVPPGWFEGHGRLGAPGQLGPQRTVWGPTDVLEAPWMAWGALYGFGAPTGQLWGPLRLPPLRKILYPSLFPVLSSPVDGLGAPMNGVVTSWTAWSPPWMVWGPWMAWDPWTTLGVPWTVWGPPDGLGAPWMVWGPWTDLGPPRTARGPLDGFGGPGQLGGPCKKGAPCAWTPL